MCRVSDGAEVASRGRSEAKDYESADRLRAELMALGVNPNKPTKAKKAQ
jgi:hypothetical protein